jgi:two-component system, OmpR family, sensor histidine kinase KdpD
VVRRALGQILDNAAKYSPNESAISVRGQIESSQFAVSVTDHGAGLDADDRDCLDRNFSAGVDTPKSRPAAVR